MQYGTIALRDAVELFLLDAQSQRFSESNERYYRLRLDLFLRWGVANGASHLDHLNRHLIRKYLAESSAHGLFAHYVHGHARAIRAFCYFLLRDGLVHANPFERVKMPRLEDKVLPALTDDEIKRLL